MDKATGIVTSVPSDSPDDYAAFMDLMKPAKRDHFGVKAEWVDPFKPIPILEVEIDGEKRQMSAEYMCEKLGVSSQNDKVKLQEAHDTCYKLGFDKGVMSTGPLKGMPVKQAKFEFRKLMIDANEAFLYSEPEKKVVSRSGDECVVAGIDQWYLKYGEESWRAQIENFLHSNDFNCYNERIQDSFCDAIAWLKEWACSRSFGLGTRVPWDETFLIESLSDSTIYMAYYTIAHLLQGDILGSESGSEGIKPEDLTDEVFDYTFLTGALPKNSKIPKASLEKMKHEFRYWYPLDCRVSARDLVQNHLTMALYNHAAIWNDEPNMWPRGFFCNGLLQMDNEKMSKSKGNFFTVEEIINKYSADAVRLACANGGDTMEPANFETASADNAILDCHVFLERLRAAVEGREEFREGKDGERFVDRWFANEMNRLIVEAHREYSRMYFREALRACYYEFGNAADAYRNVCKALKSSPNKTLMLRFFEWQLIILSPICPHICQYGWELMQREGFICNARWPVATAPVNDLIIDQGKYMYTKVPHSFTLLAGKASKAQAKPTGATIYVASKYPEWKVTVLRVLKKKFDSGELPLLNQEDKNAELKWKAIMKEFLQDVNLKKFAKHLGPFAAYKREEAASSGASALSTQTPFDESALVKEHIPFLASRLNLEECSIQIRFAEDLAAPAHSDKAAEAQPLKPAIVYEVPSHTPGGKGSPKASPKKNAKSSGSPNSFVAMANLKALDEFLSSRSYIEGGSAATEADFIQLNATANVKADQYPHVARWHDHVSFLHQKRCQF